MTLLFEDMSDSRAVWCDEDHDLAQYGVTVIFTR